MNKFQHCDHQSDVGNANTTNMMFIPKFFDKVDDYGGNGCLLLIATFEFWSINEPAYVEVDEVVSTYISFLCYVTHNSKSISNLCEYVSLRTIIAL